MTIKAGECRGGKRSHLCALLVLVLIVSTVLPARVARAAEVILSGSGTWTPPAGVTSVDVFLVGGGGGGSVYPYLGGGGGGYTATHLAVEVSGPVSYSVGVGGGLTQSGGATTFGELSVNGGEGAVGDYAGDGGSGGGGYWYFMNPAPDGDRAGGQDGGDGYCEYGTEGAGQGTTTRAFGDGDLYAGGGGGGFGNGGAGGGGNGARDGTGGWDARPATAGADGYGGGGGGGSAGAINQNGAPGGSGTIILRYAGSSPYYVRFTNVRKTRQPLSWMYIMAGYAKTSAGTPVPGTLYIAEPMNKFLWLWDRNSFRTWNGAIEVHCTSSLANEYDVLTCSFVPDDESLATLAFVVDLEQLGSLWEYSTVTVDYAGEVTRPDIDPETGMPDTGWWGEITPADPGVVKVDFGDLPEEQEGNILYKAMVAAFEYLFVVDEIWLSERVVALQDTAEAKAPVGYVITWLDQLSTWTQDAGTAVLVMEFPTLVEGQTVSWNVFPQNSPQASLLSTVRTIAGWGYWGMLGLFFYREYRRLMAQ